MNQFILRYLMRNITDRPAQTAPCTVRFGNEQYQGTNGLLDSLQLTTPLTP